MDATDTRRRPPESPLRSPLVYAAVSLTAGIVLDRVVGPSLSASVAASAGLLLWAAVAGRLFGPSRALLPLALAGVTLGAAKHHLAAHTVAPDDISHLAGRSPKPIRLRGTLVDAPRRLPAPDARDPLRTSATDEAATALIDVTAVLAGVAESPASGRVRVHVNGAAPRAYPGDVVVVDGVVGVYPEPDNPHEFDAPRFWRDRGVSATMSARGADGFAVVGDGDWTIFALLARLRQAGHDLLDHRLSKSPTAAKLSRALLLGEGAPMATADWAVFVRTGVVHILAISGQHLVVAAAAMWFVLYRLDFSRRRAALVVAAVLVAYAVLSGGRPPAVRAAVAASVVLVGEILLRSSPPANLLAAGWIVVVWLQPGDVFDAGCQLSFLAVFLLTWVGPWLARPSEDELDTLIDATRPLWQRILRRLWTAVADAYRFNLVVWAALTPLAAFHNGMVSPAAILLGPVLTWLATVALLSGFALFALFWLPPAAWACVKLVEASLSLCSKLVEVADGLGTHFHTGFLPGWWLAGVYAALAVFLATRHAPPVGPRWSLVFLLWATLGVLTWTFPARGPELRVAFLSVGHGGCVVMELPGGRVVLYDVGSMRGPDVVARTVAPYLWGRGVHRIDEVILSHSDLDHYNGLAELLARFRVGRVLTSSSFADRDAPALAVTTAALAKHGVRSDTLARGDEMHDGGVALRVLHPPAFFTHGSQNSRSLTLLIEHAGRRVLLTGDLEGEGLSLAAEQPLPEIDVLQAPHHGSHRLDIAGLVRWTRPKVAISCQASARTVADVAKMYGLGEDRFLTTHEEGAVIVTSRDGDLTVETYRTKRRAGVPR